MVVACLYYACKFNKVSRTFEELADEISLDRDNKKEVYGCLKILKSELNLKNVLSDPVSFIPRFIADLNLEPEIESPSIELLNEYNLKMPPSGKSIRGIAVGCLYAICLVMQMKPNQKQFAEITGITQTTLRRRCREFQKIIFSHPELLNPLF